MDLWASSRLCFFRRGIVCLPRYTRHVPRRNPLLDSDSGLSVFCLEAHRSFADTLLCDRRVVCLALLGISRANQEGLMSEAQK